MKKRILFSAAAAVFAAGLLLTKHSEVREESADYALKYEAAERSRRCFDAVKELKEELGIKAPLKDDINDTGMIGQEFSFITTTLGELPAKRTSTNPNMAAVVTDMFVKLGLREGDKVAINCSGSFPALNIAVLCSADVMGLDPIMISSFGASTHGANDPELTYLDMEHYLYEEGLLENKSDYFSIGGNLDIGTDMDGKLCAEISERLKGYGYKFIYNEDLIDNINERYELYNEYGDIKCFINVGGNDASFGDSMIMVHAAGGIITELSERDGSTGLVQLFLKDNIPVIHLLNLKGIASDYGLPFDPYPMPPLGDGDVYYEYKYNKLPAALSLIVGSCLLILSAYCAKKEKRELKP